MEQPNHKKLQRISDHVRLSLMQHETQGGTYYDDTAEQIAGFAIQTVMPELASMRGERVEVEAERALALTDEKEALWLNGMRVEATFQRVGIQMIVSTLYDTYSSSSYDVFAILRPHYIDPDPREIVFGDELYVPFERVSGFKLAS
jgi:hypothetical protein